MIACATISFLRNAFFITLESVNAASTACQLCSLQTAASASLATRKGFVSHDLPIPSLFKQRFAIRTKFRSEPSIVAGLSADFNGCGEEFSAAAERSDAKIRFRKGAKDIANYE
jgi:hypothetical protein